MFGSDIMANPTKIAKKKFKEIKDKDPGRASRIENRLSGEIYDLYPTSFGYKSGRIITAIFKEGKLQYVD